MPSNSLNARCRQQGLERVWERVLKWKMKRKYDARLPLIFFMAKGRLLCSTELAVLSNIIIMEQQLVGHSETY